MTPPVQAETMTRHRLSVRVCHWISAIAFCFLVVSGIAILMAHPQLYWGKDGYYGHDAWLSLPFLGTEKLVSNWGRNYHFLFAWTLVINGIIYLVISVPNKHIWRDLVPGREQLALSHIMNDIREHIHLRPPTGDAARYYNFLQKLSYLFVIFVLFPLILLTGLTMSPALTAVFPELLDIFGGRHSARSIHFICAGLLLLFVLVHIFQVVIAGFVNLMRSMITGKYVLPEEEK